MSYIPLVSITGATVRTLRATHLDTSNREGSAGTPSKSHLILVIDQSGSMYYDMAEMRATLVKLLALEEYHNADLLVSLVSYASKGETYVRIDRQPITEVMGAQGKGTAAIESLRATNLTCISGALKVAAGLCYKDEATTIVLHSDGYANDPSPYAETTSIADVLEDLAEAGVMISTVSYGRADFALLDMIASKGGGVCVQARSAGQVFDALVSASKPAVKVNPAITVKGADDSTLVGYSNSARRVFSGVGEVAIRGLAPEDDLEVWECTDAGRMLYTQPLEDSQFSATDAVVELLFARASLSAGNINAAKQAVLGARVESLYSHLRALTSPQIGAFAEALDAAIFGDTPLVFAASAGLPASKVTVLDVLEILRQHPDQYLVNIPMLTEGRTRRSIARKAGARFNGEIVPPAFTTVLKSPDPWARVSAIEMNRTTATINMNLTRAVDLINADGEAVTHVAGIPLDLKDYRNITIVGEGSVLTPDLHIKVLDKRLTQRLAAVGFAPVAGVVCIPLGEMSVVRPDIDGREFAADTTLFERLTACAIAKRILAACIEGESVQYTPEQVAEFAAHCLSKSGYYSPPTHNPYGDRAAAISTGQIDSYTTYRIELGSLALLSLSDLPSANAFLDRRFVCTLTQGDVETDKPTMNAIVMGAASVSLKPAAAIKRLKMGPADTLMLPWYLALFDHTDEEGYHEGRGHWSGLLSAAGVDPSDANDFASGGLFEKTPDDRVAMLRNLSVAIATYEDLLFSQTLAPVVLFAGATGFLPEGVSEVTTAHNAESLEAAHPGVKVPKSKRDGMFHTFPDGRLLAIRPETVWYST